MEDRCQVIAFLGKGGVGKTALSAIAGKIFLDSSRRVLFIDADPAEGLATALGLSGYKTIGRAREEIIRHARIAGSEQEKEQLADIVDYCLLEALFEGGDFSAIVMGQTNSLGCYCPVNNLLRRTIRAIAGQFDVVIIDAEAGIEQVNRQVAERVTHAFIVSDNSLRSVRTVSSIMETINKAPMMSPVKTGVIFNRVKAVDLNLTEEMARQGLEIFGVVAPDPLVADFDSRGAPLTSLPLESAAVRDMAQILDRLQSAAPEKGE